MPAVDIGGSHLETHIDSVHCQVSCWTHQN